MSNLKTFNDMGILDALKAATANVQSEPKTENPKAQAKTSAKSAPKGASAKPGASKASEKTGAKTASKGTAKPKPIDISTLKVKYEIPEDFKMAIRLYMEDLATKDSAVAEKMKAKGKSIDGCCEYIYGVMMRRAAKQLTERKNTGIGISGSPEEVFGLATHYYDETEESLKEELKTK